jgi:hypothetical protein
MAAGTVLRTRCTWSRWLRTGPSRLDNRTIAISRPYGTIAISRPYGWTVYRPIAWRSSGAAVGRATSRPTITGPVDGGWRAVVAWAITPVAAVSRTIAPHDGAWSVPDIGRTITPVPAAPGAMIVVDAATSPVPSPATPAPGAVADQQSPDADANPEGDERCRHDGAGTWSDIDDSGVILRHVDNLRVGGLNRVYGLTRFLLYLNLLLRSAAQGSRGIGLRTETLD